MSAAVSAVTEKHNQLPFVHYAQDSAQLHDVNMRPSFHILEGWNTAVICPPLYRLSGNIPSVQDCVILPHGSPHCQRARVR